MWAERVDKVSLGLLPLHPHTSDILVCVCNSAPNAPLGTNALILTLFPIVLLQSRPLYALSAEAINFICLGPLATPSGKRRRYQATAM